ncbi:MAG: sigma-70 family RNA polymerase sigma factor [Planctomycetota bacterium]
MDEELLEHVCRAQAGDLDAFCYVATAQRGRALGCALSLTQDRHAAEDAVQEAFLIALRELHRLREPRAFPAWLDALVRSATSRAARRPCPAALLAEPAVEAPPAQDLEHAERRRLVRLAVAELTPAAQAVIERFYLRGLSVAATAAELELPPGTVKRRLFDARERLRGSLLGLRPSLPSPSRAGTGLRLPL